MDTIAADPGAGYVTDIEYVRNFLPGLAPLNLALAAVLAGVRPPDVDAPFAYLDLGCGNGFTPALLAAANPHGDFRGADFLPAHIRNARATAEAAGVANATFVEASFADLLEATLPPFDFVVLHGIWSWVSQANRDRIVALLHRCLKPGGVVLVSYNCHPGYDPVLPLRRLLISAAGGGGTTVERIDRALATARRLHDGGADYFRNTPTASAALARLERADRSYLAHEYFNENWTLFYPGEVAEALAPVGLAYAAQARLVDNVDRFWLSADERALVDGESDPALAQALRDLILDRGFRRDLFVRAGAAIGEENATAWFADRRFALVKPRGNCSLTLNMRAGEFTMPPLYDEMLDALAQSPATTDALAARCAAAVRDVRDALGVLAAMGYVQPALAEAGETVRRAAADRFNDAALASARMGEPWAALVSPVTGTGVAVSTSDQLILDAARFGVSFDDADPAERSRRDRLTALAMLGIA